MDFFVIDAIESVSTFTTDESSYHTPALRSFHCLQYQLNTAESLHTVNGRGYTVNKDSLLFVNKNDTHNTVHYGATENISVLFTSKTNISSFVLNCENKPKIKNLFYKLLAHKNLRKPENYFYCMSLLYEIFYLIEYNKNNTNNSSSVKSKLNPAFMYIEEHYLDPNITNIMLSKMVNLSERHFVALFKNSYGTTPNKYIVNKKINHSIKLLTDDKYTISQIAEACGFENVYYFSTVFKKIIGLSPDKYRKKTD